METPAIHAELLHAGSGTANRPAVSWAAVIAGAAAAIGGQVRDSHPGSPGRPDRPTG